jgi:alpha-1,4-galacturonosyltransferase
VGARDRLRENENEKVDSNVRLMRDQIIMARIYSVLAKSRDKLDLYQELLSRIKESQSCLREDEIICRFRMVKH